MDHADIRAHWDALITDCSMTVGIIGLGYVGLPLAAAFHDAGIRVLGFDNDPMKIDALAKVKHGLTDEAEVFRVLH